MAELKSLAHPEWPYTGTPHEWRGFAEKQKDEAIRRYIANRGVHYSPGHPDCVYQKQNFGPDLK
jgi:hypothetical protein